jgi:hypothetical protein
MPSTAPALETEPVFSGTMCNCPRYGGQTLYHEKTCWVDYEEPKPSPHAGKRAWRKYQQVTHAP